MSGKDVSGGEASMVLLRAAGWSALVAMVVFMPPSGPRLAQSADAIVSPAAIDAMTTCPTRPRSTARTAS